MGRKETSGTSNGTSGALQTSLEQEQLANDMAQAEQKLVQEAEEILFAQLDEAGIKYTRENMLSITRDSTGQHRGRTNTNVSQKCCLLWRSHFRKRVRTKILL